MFEAAEGLAVDDTVAVSLESGAYRVRLLGSPATSR
jgi:hypothetical protein